MYPQPFSDLVKQWLTDAAHPGVSRVQTCAEVGRWEHPVGVKLTLDDGWKVFVQMVGTAPPQPRTSPTPAVPAGDWKDDPAYRQARGTADVENRAVPTAPRDAKPTLRVQDVLNLLVDVVKRADHPQVTEVQISKPDLKLGRFRPALRVRFVDDATVVGFVAGFSAPGSTDLAHAVHYVPKEWM